MTARAVVPTLVLVLACSAAPARDAGQFDQADPDTRSWFRGLRDGNGMGCCDFADGTRLEDPDWRIETDGTYAVRIDGAWQAVPADAVVKDRNRIGYPVVWTYFANGRRVVRCFMPGAGA